MRARIYLLAIAALLVIIPVLAWQAAETPSVRNGEAPATVATPGASRFEAMTEQVTDWERTTTKLLTNVVGLVALVLSVPIVLFLLDRMIHLVIFRQRQLIVADFANATGDGDLDKVIVGLSHQIREGLVDQIGVVRRVIATYNKGLGPREYHPPDTARLPQGTPDQRLADLVASIKDVAPSRFKSLIHVLGVAFPARGTRVMGTLQRRGYPPGSLGITLEVADLEGRIEPRLCTFWEAPRRSEADVPLPPNVLTAGTRIEPVRSLAQHYYDVAIQLGCAGLLRDKVEYLREALNVEPTFAEASKALHETMLRLHVQENAASAYAIGKQLQDIGLVREAIQTYIKPLPAASQPEAEAAWMIILGQVPGDESAAFLRLGDLYRMDGVHLVAEALELYRIAASDLDEAKRRLDGSRKELARHLVGASRRLLQIGRASAAEKYLTAALEYVPEDAQIQAMMAAVRHVVPPTAAPEAIALRRLGDVSARRGDYDQAKALYEEALRKQPAYDEAVEALDRVIASRLTLVERYIRLLDPTSRWLAAEIARHDMLAGMPRLYRRKRRRRYRAEVYNFIGNLYLSSALTYGDPFFDHAMGYLERAIRLDNNWYQPYENLAQTYRYMWSARQDVSLLADALVYYAKALERVDDVSERQERLRAKRRIRVKRALCQLRTGRKDLIERAKADIERNVLKDWIAEKERDGNYLYNLASWYAASDEGAASRAKARRYLAYSLARSRDLWHHAATDEDFEAIRADHEIDKLKSELLRKIGEVPELGELTGEPFAEKMEQVLRSADWC